MKKIFVTGGSGFIGSSIITELEKSTNYNFISYDLNHDKVQGIFESECIEGSIVEEEKLMKAMKGADIVIHLAGGGGEANCLRDPVNSVLVNVLGTELVVKSSKFWNVKQLIFASSIYTYSSYRKREIPFKEQDKQYPDSFYGSLKLTCEEIIRNSGIDHVICRFSNVYGVGSGTHFIGGALGNFVNAVINKSNIYIWGKGQNLIDYINIDDVIIAINTLIKNGVKNKVYNFGGGTPISVHELAESIVKQANKMGFSYNHDIVNKKGDEKALSDLWLNIIKAKEELNWRPTVNINNGIAGMIKYGRNYGGS